MAIGIFFHQVVSIFDQPIHFSANSVEYFALKPYWLACSNEFTERY